MRFFPLFVLAMLAGAGTAAAELRVVDGDTLELAGEVVRINGIDAPEAGQKCARPGGGTWPCGREAVAAMAALVEAAEVSCERIETDRYGRSIATCFANGRDVGRQLVAGGHAWAFRRFSEVYAPEEDAARAAGRGIWQAETQTPWDYRADRWSRAVAEVPPEAPPGCPIKGNVSESGRIYHAPWSPWYGRTKIGNHPDERWFCDEGEAVAAGWRAPYWW